MNLLYMIYAAFVVFAVITFLAVTRVIHRNSVVAFTGYAITAATTIGSLLTFAYFTGNWNNRLVLVGSLAGYFLILAIFYVGLMYYADSRFKKPLQSIIAINKGIAEGNLTARRLELDLEYEMAELTESIMATCSRLSGIVSAIAADSGLARSGSLRVRVRRGPSRRERRFIRAEIRLRSASSSPAPDRGVPDWRNPYRSQNPFGARTRSNSSRYFP